MTYHGRVQKGMIVLTGDVSLPEGTEVRVETIEASDEDDIEARKLSDELAKLAGTVKDLPPDFARNHDAYIRRGSLSDRLLKLAGTAGPGLPRDLARNHDRYLHRSGG